VTSVRLERLSAGPLESGSGGRDAAAAGLLRRLVELPLRRLRGLRLEQLQLSFHGTSIPRGCDSEPACGWHDATVAAVWLVTGAQASGKSTVADLLARRFPQGVHVRGGEFYRWAVTGWTHVGDPDEDEVRRLLDLRYDLSSTVADRYAAAGFTTVVQDNIYGPDVERWLGRIRAASKHLVVLRPRVEVVEARDIERQRRTGKVAYRGGFTPAINDEHLASTNRSLGLWLDTSDQSAEATVDEILRRAEEARIE
jgi:predicted kinase